MSKDNQSNSRFISKYFFLHNRFFMDVISIKYVLSICFNIYLFILIFDVTREALPIPTIINIFLSAIRDFSLYIILIYILITKKSIVYGYKSFFILMYILIPLIMYFANILDGISEDHELGVVIQFCILAAKPFIFLYLLRNLDLYYLFDKENIIKTFISITVLMVLVSFGVYFCTPDLIVKYKLENRIGLGNMSIQSGIYCCAYFLCLYFFPFKKNLFNLLYIFILLAGIVLSVCSTGILSMIVGTFLFLMDKKTRKRSLLIIIVIVTIGLYAIIRYYTLFSSFFVYFEMKAEHVIDLINNLFSEKKHETKSASFHARELQIENVLKNHNALIDRFFGHGYFSITDTKIFLENTYYAVYFDCGFFGIVLMAIILLQSCLKALKLWIKEKKYIGIVAIISLCFFMTTLDISIGPAISSSFIFFLYIIFNHDFYHEVIKQ